MKKQITKSYLEYLGVINVTEDGKVFTSNGELKPQACSGYLCVRLYDSEKYKSVPKDKRNLNSGKVTILVHHVVFAWFHGEVPYAKEIHHKTGDHLNNSITNLEALTTAEHRAKHVAMRAETGYNSTRELKCRLDIPRAWYQKQLDEVIALEHKTKVNLDKISNYRAKLRYYDSHIEEAQNLAEFKKDLAELKAWKQTFKERGNLKNWHECCTIEKAIKENGIESWPMVKHALEVAHRHFGGDLQ